MNRAGLSGASPSGKAVSDPAPQATPQTRGMTPTDPRGLLRVVSAGDTQQRAMSLQAWQRSVGNAALTRILGRSGRAPRRQLHRYEAGEHAVFGGPGKTLTVGGVTVTEGELAAMGDFYLDPDKMSADATGNSAAFEKLVKDIRADRDARAAGKAGVAEGVWISDTAHRPKGETYADLAAQNFAHFAPGKTPGPNHKQMWEDLHRKALDLAHAAAAGDKQVPDQARIVNAFAAHFLTDAFSAGHLANKKELMDAATTKFDALPTTGVFAKENSFSKGVARGMVSDPTISAELAKWELKIAGWGDFTQERTSELIYGMRGEDPQLFFSLFARTVHDSLDDAIRSGSAAGLEVINDNGDVWTLAGDETLHLSPTTEKIAGQAVQAARDNLAVAASTAGPLDYTALFKNAWRFTPRPTTDAEHTKALADKAARDAPKPPAPPGLQSPRWGSPPNPKLEQCLDDKARLGPHDPDSDAVTKLQQALVDVEAITHKHYDLGPTGVDGKFGSHTAAAVKKFKEDQGLGSTQYPDVGPGTMAELDRLFIGAAPKPPPGPTLEPGSRAGAGQLSDAVSTFTDPGNQKTVDAIVKLAGVKLDALLAILQTKGRARPKKKKK